MEQYDIGTWDEFPLTIKNIRQEYGYFELPNSKSKKNIMLFRGHGNAEWPLKTTLERKQIEDISVNNYLRYAFRCINELESFTGKKWDIPELSLIEKEIKDISDSWRPPIPYSVYNYLVYLRHHGFPSPLLDWTTSPYIAAYFSYYENYSFDRVAVFAYIERPKGVKGGMGGVPRINAMGPYVTTDSRHFSQKAWYTVASKYDYKNKENRFCDHSRIFEQDKEYQDILIKITMPSSERLKALEGLSDYNINHFTLFQTEDSLVKALSIKEFDLNGI